MNFFTGLLVVAVLLTIGITVCMLYMTKFVSHHACPAQPETSPEEVASPAAGEGEEDTAAATPKSSAPKKKWRFSAETLLQIMLLILVVIGILDELHVVNFGIYQGAYIFLTLIAAAEYVIYLFLRQWHWKTLRFAAKLILVAAVLEVTVFQFPSYHMLGGDYQQVTLSPADAEVESGTLSYSEETGAAYISGEDEVILSYTDLDQEVRSIHVEYGQESTAPRLKMSIDLTDETTSTDRSNLVDVTLVRENAVTNTIACQFNGKVGHLRFKFTGVSDGQSIDIHSITLNAPIAFDLYPLRFFLIVGLGTFAYAIAKSDLLRRSYARAKAGRRVGMIGMTVVMIALSAAIVFKGLSGQDLLGQFTLTGGNQITQELVDAFEQHQISLLREPSEGLLNLENPYDWGTRNESGVDAAWDHVLYNGKYYSYYGVAPVFLLYLPYHLITGYYCSTNFSVLLFGVLGLIFLAMTYNAIVKRWFGNVPLGCVLAGLAVLFSACGIWFSVSRPLFYEIAVSCGFAFATMGAYFLITANILGDGRISFVRTAAASLCFGLAVLSRPTLAVYAMCAALFFLMAVKRSGSRVAADGTVSDSKVRRIVYLLCAGLPLVLLGGFQMWYNYARFGSPLDFGIQYSLTINDFTHTQYQTFFVLIGLYHYLFAMPSVQVEYPFLTTPFSKLGVNGYYFSDSGNTSGILYLALPTFAYLLSGRVMRRLGSWKARLRAAVTVGLPCLVMPLVIIVSIWESGYAVRYTADFSWEIIMGALVILFYLYQKTKRCWKQQAVRYFLAVSMVAAVIVNGVQIFNFAFSYQNYAVLCSQFEQMVAFWR